MRKNPVADYLTFSKKERTGIIVLLILILFFTILPFFFSSFIKSGTTDSGNFEKEIAALKIKQTDSSENHYSKNFDENNYQNYYQPSEKNYYSDKPKGELFYFDPNTLDDAGWKRLGIRDKTIATIRNYVSKGGKFYKPEDISKIWGLHENEVERLLPFIRIASAGNFVKKENYENKIFEKPTYSPSVIDINSADTTMLIALPGIGSKLSQRILSYRDKLGGFYKVEQIAETYGLPDSTFQKIKARFTLNNNSFKKININAATVDEMKSHPYLKFAIANAIVQYRLQHGNYSSVNDLKKIMLITDDVFIKMSPYLTVN